MQSVSKLGPGPYDGPRTLARETCVYQGLSGRWYRYLSSAFYLANTHARHCKSPNDGTYTCVHASTQGQTNTDRVDPPTITAWIIGKENCIFCLAQGEAREAAAPAIDTARCVLVETFSEIALMYC